MLPQDARYLSAEWTKANVSGVGLFGEFYRVWGDGKQMVPHDIFDYFGFSGLTTEQLKGMGYVVWTAPQEKGSWISEGDTSIFMNLLDNGLRGYLDPSYGGWGGRNGPDTNPSGQSSATYAASRPRPAGRSPRPHP
ncbi:nucleoside hydrolase-like domain-containing protein [Nonomuraea guangzhouensis]|uniref:Nucleoside hydrolase-like domain-containing protein n=1 Tax=Nonomuraea guangzhouensis TaxID=1291555 RepID=A0ABW4GN82_9ACTN|nr:nucleoside hydrolase-like domain-containing protein [Nonomuraea guangzhouensis]